MDWAAFGLPLDKGENGPVMVIEQMERQVPTCGLNESVGEAKQRAKKLGFQICVVMNEQGVVSGVIGKNAWEKDSDITVESVMEPGPTTLRPSYSVEDAKDLVMKSSRDAIITSSDGRLLGLFTGHSR
jgi:CBS domain-containing protein